MNLVNESFIPFLNEDFLVEEYLNERFDLNSIKSVAKKAAVIAGIIAASLSLSGEKSNILKQQLYNSSIVLNLARQTIISREDIKRTLNQITSSTFVKNFFINPKILQDALTLKTSHQGKDFIKHHEHLKLKAYELGDNKITIGWGHAEPDLTSHFKVGDKISRRQAEVLFNKDLKTAENGVRRLFQKWEEQGYEIKITQHMWDAMVSMAFNMGVGGLRGSEIVQALKAEDYFKAADLIPLTNVDQDFPGLLKRREKERELFLRGL